MRNIKKENLRPNELNLFEGIDLVLRNNWKSASQLTPGDLRGCHAELFHLALAGVPLKTITHYLRNITIEKLGSAASADHMDAAQMIHKLIRQYISSARAE